MSTSEEEKKKRRLAVVLLCCLLVVLLALVALPALATTFYATPNDMQSYLSVDNISKTLSGYIHIADVQPNSGPSLTIGTDTLNPATPTGYLNLTFTDNLTNQSYTPAGTGRGGSTLPAQYTYSFASGGSIMLNGYINGQYIQLTGAFSPSGSDLVTVNDPGGANESQTMIAHYNGSLNQSLATALGLPSSLFTGGLIQMENTLAAFASGSMTLGTAETQASSVPVPPGFYLFATALFVMAVIRKRLR